MSLRRRLISMAQEGKSMFEPFYSDYPELTEKGLYTLTPQTEDTDIINSYIEIGDKVYTYAGAPQKKEPYFILISNKVTRVFKGDLLATSNNFTSTIFVEGANTVRFKRCKGLETDEPLVTLYVEKIL